MGSVSIDTKYPLQVDLSLANIWKSWYLFRRGKISVKELECFAYFLEKNLSNLFVDLNSSTYEHGSYRQFIVCDNKKRRISVANIRDRVVHRLLYEYLKRIYDKTFIYDVWSCRKGKGLTGAIERTQKFVTKYPCNFIWRVDIKKFFDNVNHRILLDILRFRIKDEKALKILGKIIKSYWVRDSERERE